MYMLIGKKSRRILTKMSKVVFTVLWDTGDLGFFQCFPH